MRNIWSWSNAKKFGFWPGKESLNKKNKEKNITFRQHRKQRSDASNVAQVLIYQMPKYEHHSCTIQWDSVHRKMMTLWWRNCNINEVLTWCRFEVDPMYRSLDFGPEKEFLKKKNKGKLWASGTTGSKGHTILTLTVQTLSQSWFIRRPNMNIIALLFNEIQWIAKGHF